LTVTALHGVAFLGLVTMHIVDARRPDTAIPAISYITLTPLPVVKPARTKPVRRSRSGGTLDWLPKVYIPLSPNTITVPNIARYLAKHPPSTKRNCPLVVRRDTPDWKRLCDPDAPAVEPDEEEFDDAAIKRNAAAFARIEAEQRKRHQPPKVPCTDTQRFKNPGGGPYQGSAAMVDVGCAARAIFGR
jgi:hypothetical protein